GGGGGWVHPLDSRPSRIQQHSSIIYNNAIAPLDHRDAVYRGLLHASGLDQRHREQLAQRGYTHEQYLAREYRTLGLTGRARKCRSLLDGGSVLDGVPGFFHKDSEAGPCWTIAGSPGLLIPCRAPDGRIRALRIRPDDPNGGGKYRWLS